MPRSPSRAFRAVAALLAPLVLAAGVAVAAVDAAAAPRTVLPLTERWSFAFGDRGPRPAPTAAETSGWSTVALPHTWNARDGADGGSDYARGDGWYVRGFTSDAAWSGRRVILEVDAANRSAEVWLNGARLGTHVGGFSRFRFDLTAALAPPGAANTLALRVNNAPDDAPPVSADFTFFGGLYRGVRLVVVDALHFDLLDHGSAGVDVTPRDVSAAVATLSLAARVRNDSPGTASATLGCVVRDAAGRIVARDAVPVETAAGTTAVVERALPLPSPRLWRGRADPHLYTAEFTLVSAAGEVRDRVTRRFGVRTLRVDPARGFLLNGEPRRLAGVNLHQDRAGRGWAVSADDIREDFALVTELGADAVRLAHYPHAELAYDLADELGLVVWAEIPVVNEVPDDDAYAAHAKAQLREMIAQLRGHPSICFWGVGNETRAVGDGPGRNTPDAPAADRLLGELHALARALDPTRPTTYASHHRPEDVRNFRTDVLAFNKYLGWYGAQAEEIGPWLDRVHARWPERAIGLSEYGAGASLRHHDLSLARPAPGGPWHPEEYQAHFHEVHWRALRERPWVWGSFVWNLCDFAADDRREGDAAGMNDKGLVTYDRRTRKDAFHWFRANWSREPVLHVAGRRHVARGPGETMITVYSNASAVALFVGGRPLGRLVGDDRVFRWKTTLAAGPQAVTARAEFGGRELVDTIQLSGDAPAAPSPATAAPAATSP